MADTIARESRLPITRVFTPGNAALAKEHLHVIASHAEKRPDQTLGGYWQNARQSSQPRAAQHPEEDGLGLIVARVPQSDPIGKTAPDQIVKKLAPGPACSLFQIATWKSRDRAVKIQTSCARHRRHETFVFIRIRAPKLMVEMRDCGDSDVQFPKDMQEANRIRPARHRDDHAGSMGAQHVVTGNGRGYALEHNLMLPSRDSDGAVYRLWMWMPPPEVRICSKGPPPLIAARRLWPSREDGTPKSLETPPPLVLASTSRRTLLASATVMLPPEVDIRLGSLG
jgi:hypothetical protein